MEVERRPLLRGNPTRYTTSGGQGSDQDGNLSSTTASSVVGLTGARERTAQLASANKTSAARGGATGTATPITNPSPVVDDGGSWLQQRVAAYPIFWTTVACCSMIGTSAGLISYNKFLIHGPFPYAIALTWWHMLFCTVFSLGTYSVIPKSFTTVQALRNGVPLREYAVFLLPVAFCFGLGVVLSNVAYKYAGIPFLQMMKEMNVGIVYVGSLLAGLEQFSGKLLAILAVVLVGSYFSITGEAHFVLLGFVVQFSSQLFMEEVGPVECARIVLVNGMLSSNGNSWGVKRVDPLSFLLLVSPCCLLVLSVALCFTWDQAILAAFAANWKHLVGNGCASVALNVVTALMMTAFAAITFVIVGILKDVLIVMAGVMLFGDTVSPKQAAGFGVQVVGCALYGYARAMGLGQPATSTSPSKEDSKKLASTDKQDHTEKDLEANSTAKRIMFNKKLVDAAALDGTTDTAGSTTSGEEEHDGHHSSSSEFVAAAGVYK